MDLLTLDLLVSTLKEILATKHELHLRQPPPLVGVPSKENFNKYCDYHNEKGHNTSDYFYLKRQLEIALDSGKLNHLVKDVRQKEKGRQKGNGPQKGKVINMVRCMEDDQKRKSIMVDEDWMNVPITLPPVRVRDLPEEAIMVEVEIEVYLIQQSCLRGEQARFLDGPIIMNEQRWIQGYPLRICHAISNLVNGSPTAEFPFFRGLKQGDPLAPFLFILVMESLHLSVSRAVSEGVFKGIQLHGSMSISHLFYADDAVFIGEWSDANLVSLVRILNCFYLASGLKINLQKSQVLGVGVSTNVTNHGASLIGCGVMRTPFRYLGVSVGAQMSRNSAWANTIQKLHSRLSRWKVKTLSVGGRLTLLKSVLGASPLYNLSIYKAPKGVLHDMESIRSTFFNGADPSERKITWVAWEKVLASKKNGGLGVSSFHALNRALLLKWVWRFLSQDGSIWSRVISAIYGPSLEHHQVNHSSSWCSILRETRLLASKGFDFVSHCKKRVGDGQNTRFWSDTWISDLLLCVRFPRLFALEEDKEVFVASKLGSSSVDSSFRRLIRDGIERQQWSDLSSLLESVILSPSKDRWFCDLNGEGAFRVKDARSIIDDIFLPSSEVATSRGVVLDSSLCPLCGLAPEDASYVLFRCELSKHVFRRICRWWDLDWLDVSSFPDWDGCNGCGLMVKDQIASKCLVVMVGAVGGVQ
ncbi:RNA-directed DNA polymerase, eukaryota [Tanacetum coccineum]